MAVVSWLFETTGEGSGLAVAGVGIVGSGRGATSVRGSRVKVLSPGRSKNDRGSSGLESVCEVPGGFEVDPGLQD